MSNHYDPTDTHSLAALYACAEPPKYPRVIGRVIMPDPLSLTLTELRRKMSHAGFVGAWRRTRVELMALL